LCIVKDTAKYLEPLYIKLMQLSTKKMPLIWKTARVIPLHKKGIKTDLNNYRPISNLCSMDKLFEKVVLQEMNRRYGDLDGHHQHGFKNNHSTSTAILQIQRDIAKSLDDKKLTMLYSCDLSAAFDLLRKRTFFNTLKDVLDKDIMNIIMDFLSDRGCRLRLMEFLQH